MSYLLEVIVFQLLFFILYSILKKETFYQYNRIYLLLSSLLSYVIPCISLSLFQKSEIPEIIENTLPTLYISASNETVTTLSENNSLLFGWGGVWILGSVVMFIVFALKIKTLVLHIRKEKRIRSSQVLFVELINSQMAFSFLNCVFIGDQLHGKEREMVIEHELIHVKQKHSWDVLFFEIQRILFWFNPMIYLYQKEIKAQHEFLVDQQIITNRGTKEYCKTLLEQVFKAPALSLVHTFYKQSLIKKRIAMLTKRESKSNAKLKYVLVVPVILGMLVYTSCSSTKKVNKNQEVVTSVSDAVTSIVENIPIQAIQVSPIFPGCEESDDVKKCFDKSLQKFIMKNFDTAIAEKLGLIGIQKMNAVFTIDNKGDIVDAKVNGKYKELKNEFLRVIKALPTMKPGSQNGENCNVLYQMPLVFRVGPKEKLAKNEE